jgi:rubrerythrin
MTERTMGSGDDESDGWTNEGRRESLSPSRRRFLNHAGAAGGAFALLSAGTGAAAAGGSETDGGNDTASEGNEEEASEETESEGTENVSAVDVLNFALSLEHLEATYYNQFLEEYSEKEVERSEAARVFADPGSRFSTYQKIQQVRDHEEAHVEALTGTIEELGGDPVDPAEYDFPYDSIEEFVSLSATIEAVGVSAYAGAAPLIESDAVLEAAVSIHSVEARHTAYFRVLNTNTPFPNAFDEPRTMEGVLDIVSQFVVGMEDRSGDADESEESEGEAGNGEGDESGAGELSIAGLRAVAGPMSSPDQEYVQYVNSGDGTLDLTGWSVSNTEGATYEFPDGFTLAPGETVKLYTGRGTDSSGALYWGKPQEVWNDQIGTMIVRNGRNEVVLRRSY